MWSGEITWELQDVGGSVAILLIEDDERIAAFVGRGLRAAGYTVEIAATGPEGLELALSGNVSVVILDLMLPDMDGRDVCREIRAAGVKTPIVMLTAMDAVERRVEGLRLGADDYLTKPFAFSALLARIEALLRRGEGFEERPERLSLSDLSFDRDTLEVRRGDDVIALTAKELALLELLLRRPFSFHLESYQVGVVAVR